MRTERYRALLAGKAEELVQRMVDAALGGDAAALRWCCDRLIPPLRAQSTPVVLPLSGTLDERGEAVLSAASDGKISIDECRDLLRRSRLKLKLRRYPSSSDNLTN